MQLTKQTDLGLRTLMYLALHPERRVAASEIAMGFGVSQHHLLKVIGRLAAAGIVETHRGKAGGLTLAVAPEDLRVGTVVRELEDRMQMIDCDRPRCVIHPVCHLKEVVDDALEAFLDVLDGCTLNDLVRGRHQHMLNLLWQRPTEKT